MNSSFLRLFVTPPVGYAGIPLSEGDMTGDTLKVPPLFLRGEGA